MRPMTWTTTWMLSCLWACSGTSNGGEEAGGKPREPAANTVGAGPGTNGPGTTGADRKAEPATNSAQPLPTAGPAPKPLGAEAQKALAWLVARQHESGGFGQGDESPQMSAGTASKDQPNVGDTCAAALALLRSGSTPKDGPWAAALRKALGYVCAQVEASDKDSLYVTDQRGTRLQAKLGTYIDTFLAAMLFAEVKGRMADEAAEKRLFAALDKVMDKIERNQKADGSWANQGWATVLAQGVAGKALNRASQLGWDVDARTLARVDSFSRGRMTAAGGAAGPDSAGVKLYAESSNFSVLTESESTLKAREGQLREVAAKAPEGKERDAAKRELDRLAETGKLRAAAEQSVVKQLDDPGFVAGFGSNGGEEFLSYMNLSESLRARGGDEWTQWDQKISANLRRIQNQDGSWSGHHCITGRTFCTSAALLVLMADRAPVRSEKVASGK